MSKNVFSLTPDLCVDLGKLYECDMSDLDRECLEGISRWVTTNQVVTLRQLQVLGRLYKRYLQNGEYVHHNWVIWNKAS